ncbi:MAG TPA: hypothetical protein VFK74_03705 [Azospira sp.]|nr:hypothetical protein [Azospira sp.]
MEIQQQPLAAHSLLPSWLMDGAEQDNNGILWDDTEHLPSAPLTFLLIALPLSLLLPIMANFAGAAYGSRVITGFAPLSWERLLTILCLELAMIPLLAGLTQLAGRFFQVAVNRRQAFLIVTLSTIPLWLASLSLAVPSLAIILMAGTIGVALAGIAMYRCIRRLLGVHDDSLVMLFSGLIMVCTLPAWTIILAVVLIR